MCTKSPCEGLTELSERLRQLADLALRTPRHGDLNCTTREPRRDSGFGPGIPMGLTER